MAQPCRSTLGRLLALKSRARFVAGFSMPCAPFVVDFRSQPNTLRRSPYPRLAERPPRPPMDPGGAVSPVEGTVDMCSIGPGAILRPQSGTSFQTQPDGRSASSVLPLG